METSLETQISRYVTDEEVKNEVYEKTLFEDANRLIYSMHVERTYYLNALENICGNLDYVADKVILDITAKACVLMINDRLQLGNSPEEYIRKTYWKKFADEFKIHSNGKYQFITFCNSKKVEKLEKIFNQGVDYYNKIYQIKKEPPIKSKTDNNRFVNSISSDLKINNETAKKILKLGLKYHKKSTSKKIKYALASRIVKTLPEPKTISNGEVDHFMFEIKPLPKIRKKK